MSTIIIVPKAKLRETPKAFQMYVEKFFVERRVLEQNCFVASTKLFSATMIG